MLLVHFIKLAACTGGVLFSPFHIECQSCCCGHFINSKRFGSFSVELKRGHCQGCTQRLYGESQGNHNDIISRKRCRTWFFLVLGSRIDLNRLGMDLVGISARLGEVWTGSLVIKYFDPDSPKLIDKAHENNENKRIQQTSVEFAGITN